MKALIGNVNEEYKILAKGKFSYFLTKPVIQIGDHEIVLLSSALDEKLRRASYAGKEFIIAVRKEKK